MAKSVIEATATAVEGTLDFDDDTLRGEKSTYTAQPTTSLPASISNVIL